MKIFRTLVALFLVAPVAFESDASAETVSFFSGAYTVTYDGRTYDAGTDRTLFQYTVEAFDTSGGLGFSHITFEIPLCNPGLEIDGSLTSPSGYSIGPDPTTQVDGIKWENVTINDGETQVFVVAYIGNIAEDMNGVSIKTGQCNSNPNSNSPKPDCEILDITGPSCEAGNAPPTCDAGGPYSVECGSGTGQAVVSGSGSDDPEGDGLNYAWTTDCPSGSFDDGSLENPTLDYDTIDGGMTVSCQVFLTVDDGNGGEDSCQATVNSEGTSCDVDCLGEPGGDAVFDDCGVCDGNNEDKDSCNVCFGNDEDVDDCGDCFGNNEAQDDCGICDGGNEDKDGCDLCFGDGTSCNVCKQSVILEEQFGLDGLGLEYTQFVKKLVKRFRKKTGKKKALQSTIDSAEALYTQNWVLTWSIPTVLDTDCSVEGVCVKIDNTPTLGSYQENHDSMGALASKVINKLKKKGLGVKRAKKRKKKLDQADVELIKAIPAEAEDCG